MATAGTICSAWQAQPFQPFTLRLVDGTQYDFNGREWISLPASPRARGGCITLPSPMIPTSSNTDGSTSFPGFPPWSS